MIHVFGIGLGEGLSDLTPAGQSPLLGVERFEGCLAAMRGAAQAKRVSCPKNTPIGRVEVGVKVLVGIGAGYGNPYRRRQIADPRFNPFQVVDVELPFDF